MHLQHHQLVVVRRLGCPSIRIAESDLVVVHGRPIPMIVARVELLNVGHVHRGLVDQVLEG